jgi:hypothetical protein
MDPAVFDKRAEKPVYGVHLEQAVLIQVYTAHWLRASRTKCLRPSNMEVDIWSDQILARFKQRLHLIAETWH